MHKSSYDFMRDFVESHLDKAVPLRILDVGSYDVCGSYRDLFQSPDWEYVGIDIRPGPNVDIVVEPYDWLALEKESFDVVISGSTFEYVRDLARVGHEVSRVLKVGGKVCFVAPWVWPSHDDGYDDCWRISKVGMEWFLRDACGLQVEECQTVISSEPGCHDCFGIAEKETGQGKFTVASVYLDEAILEEHLMPSITGDVVETVFQRGNPCQNLAAFYNKVWDNAKGEFVVFCHSDMKFHSSLYDRTREAFRQDDVEIVGIFGKIPRTWDFCKLMLEFDSSFLAVRRDSGFRFDSIIFNGLHQYVEDLCWQTLSAGKKSVDISSNLEWSHFGETFNQEERRWIDQYLHYRGLLRKKWSPCRLMLEGEKPLTFLGVEDGTGLKEFEQMLFDFPAARKIVLKRGSMVSPMIPDVEVLTCRVEDLRVRPDFAIFPVLGLHNLQDYIQILQRGIPVIVKPSCNYKGWISQCKTGFIYEEMEWAVNWIVRSLAGDIDLKEMSRQMIEEFAKVT